MLDSLRHVRIDIRTERVGWQPFATVIGSMMPALGATAQDKLYWYVFNSQVTVISLRSSIKAGPETTRPVAVSRDGSCLFNSVLAVDPVGQGQRR
ncbi:hypothetical protein ASC85_03185 [Pseudomonas sp. Root401]|nr:hypothetical protein ASC85_03185 [Pseudomonas sp. Root401]